MSIHFLLKRKRRDVEEEPPALIFYPVQMIEVEEPEPEPEPIQELPPPPEPEPVTTWSLLVEWLLVRWHKVVELWEER